MKTTAAVAAVTGLIASANAQYFGLISARSASPIHFAGVSASDHSLWLNKPTAAYCPENVGDACPAGNVTTFAGGDGSLSMGVVVPGGQQVYIEADTGRVKYTIAHSAAVPEGAVRTGWTLSSEGLGSLANEQGGFVACPCEDDSWKVFVGLEGVKFEDDCLGFNAITSNTTVAGAWQYS